MIWLVQRREGRKTRKLVPWWAAGAPSCWGSWRNCVVLAAPQGRMEPGWECAHWLQHLLSWGCSLTMLTPSPWGLLLNSAVTMLGTPRPAAGDFRWARQVWSGASTAQATPWETRNRWVWGVNLSYGQRRGSRVREVKSSIDSKVQNKIKWFGT